MKPISAVQSTVDPRETTASRLLSHSLDHGPKADVKSTFQDVVAGTFYKEMLKSLRKMHDKPSYFHGGQAEEIFQGQMDQQVAEDMAHHHGAALSDGLFQAFLQNGRA